MTSRSKATEETIDALAQTSFAVTSVLTRIAAERDVSLTLLRVLGILIDHEPRMAELADYLGVERSTISSLIDRAERRGLVERRPDPADARATVVVLAKGARGLVDEVRAQLAAELSPMLAGLAVTDLRSLTQLLRATVAQHH